MFINMELFLVFSFILLMVKVLSSSMIMSIFVCLEFLLSIVLVWLGLLSYSFFHVNLVVLYIVIMISESVVGLSIIMSFRSLQSELDKSKSLYLGFLKWS